MNKSKPVKRYILIEQGVVNAVINAVLGAGIGYLLFIDKQSIPFYGENSLFQDIVATAFILPVILGFIVYKVTRKQVDKNLLHIPAHWKGGTKNIHPFIIIAICSFALGILSYAVLELLPEDMMPVTVDSTLSIWVKAAVSGVFAAITATFVAYASVRAEGAALRH